MEKYKSGIPANSAVHNYHFVKTDRVNKESKTKKLILGFRNKHRSFFNNEYELDIAIHTGSGKMKNNKSSFTKFVGNAAFKYNLNPEWRFSVDLYAQIAPSSIPLNELFVPANTYGGRGMLFMESNVYSAIVAAPQISYFQKIKHPWLYLMKPYLYYEFSAGKLSVKNNEPSSNPRSDSIGTGADFFVVDNLIFNIEYNRRIGPNSSSLNKKSNIYAGLIYNFSFN